MTKLPIVIVVAGAALLTGVRATAQSKPSPLQGVWQTVAATTTGPGARTITFPEPLANLIIFTAKHYTRVEVQSETPRQPLANTATATADQLRATWGPVVAEAGTYEVTGDRVTMRPVASKNPAVMGAGVFITYWYTIEGNTLSIAQVQNQSGPFANSFTTRSVRVE